MEDNMSDIQKCLSCKKEDCTNCLEYDHSDKRPRKTFNIHGRLLTTKDIEEECKISYSVFVSMRSRRKLTTEETYDFYRHREERGWKYAHKERPGMEDVGRDIPIQEEVVRPTE